MKHPDLQNLKQVKAFILDVDGVLTDGSVLVNEQGEHWRTMNIKDGYAIQHAVKKGYQFIVISGGRSQGVKLRLNALGVQEVHLGVQEKMEVFTALCKRLNLAAAECLYIGDDVPDLEVMKHCGVSACPEDAVWQIRETVDLISTYGGGRGCVRDVIEQVMSLQGTW